MPKPKELPAPVDPDAGYCTVCPYCNFDGLYVVFVKAEMGGVLLGEDGFSTMDANFFNTTDEVVQCGGCRKEFPLAEVTR